MKLPAVIIAVGLDGGVSVRDANMAGLMAPVMYA